MVSTSQNKRERENSFSGLSRFFFLPCRGGESGNRGLGEVRWLEYRFGNPDAKFNFKGRIFEKILNAPGLLWEGGI